MPMWIPLLIMSNLAFVAVMVGLVLHYQSKRAQRLSEERLRILDRFNSADELNAFLASDSGQQLFERFSARPTDPRKVILGFCAAAIVMLFMSGAFFLLSGKTNDFIVPTALICCTAVGLLVACWISLTFVQRWKLAPRDGGDGD